MYTEINEKRIKPSPYKKKSGLNVKGGNKGGHEGMKAPHTTEKAVSDPPQNSLTVDCLQGTR